MNYVRNLLMVICFFSGPIAFADIACQIEFKGEVSQEFTTGEGISFEGFRAYCSTSNALDLGKKLLYCTFGGGPDKQKTILAAADYSLGYILLLLQDKSGSYTRLKCAS